MKSNFGKVYWAVGAIVVLSFMHSPASAEKIDAQVHRMCEITDGNTIKFSKSKITCCNPSTKLCTTCNKDETNCIQYPYQPKKNVSGNGGKPITKAQ